MASRVLAWLCLFFGRGKAAPACRLDVVGEETLSFRGHGPDREALGAVQLVFQGPSPWPAHINPAVPWPLGESLGRSRRGCWFHVPGTQHAYRVEVFIIIV